MKYLRIDPPGQANGWVYDIHDLDQIPGILAGHPIPDDNDAHRDDPDTYWAVTLMGYLPTDLPADVAHVKTAIQ